jgi:hypothetical protein
MELVVCKSTLSIKVNGQHHIFTASTITRKLTRGSIYFVTAAAFAPF